MFRAEALRLSLKLFWCNWERYAEGVEGGKCQALVIECVGCRRRTVADEEKQILRLPPPKLKKTLWAPCAPHEPDSQVVIGTS
jgi:hypothetical protein